MVGSPVIKSFEQKLESETHICREALDKWLRDQDLSLSHNQKKKVTYLLVHYIGANRPVTEEHVLNLLGNLGGGHFDFDDMESVEIEIQRLLGNTRSLYVEKDKKFYKKYMLVALILFSVFAISTSALLLRGQFLSSSLLEEKQKNISEAQMKALYKLTDEIIVLSTRLNRPQRTRDEIILLVGAPLGINDAHVIQEKQFEPLKGILQNFQIELLKQQP
jgi:hypothetical protein